MTLLASSLQLKIYRADASIIGLDTETAMSHFRPAEAIKFGNICPVCGRTLTKGVELGFEEVANCPADFKRETAHGFLRLLPLSEIIATVLGVDLPSTQAVWKKYNLLIEKFGNEYTVLMDAPLDAMVQVVDLPMAQAIVVLEDGQRKVKPGDHLVMVNESLANLMCHQQLKLKPKLTQPVVKQKRV